MPVARALLIGNSTFPEDPHNLPELRGPVNDVASLRDALTDSEVGLFHPTDVRIVAERTKAELTTAIEELLRSAAIDDLVLLYYSGHGQRDEYDQLFLCARDTRTDLLQSTAVSDAVINNMIRSSAATTFVIVLDCCYSGAFKGGGLADRLQGQGRFVIASSRRSELSADAADTSGVSPFTGCLVEAIKLGTLEADSQGFISLDTIYEYVHRQLRIRSRQIPQRHFDHAVGEVMLARARSIAAQSASTAPDRVTPVPRLAVSVPDIDFGVLEFGRPSPTKRVEFHNAGGGRLDAHARSDQPWLHLRQVGMSLEVSVRTALTGSLTGVIKVSSNGGDASVLVVARVLRGPELDVPRCVDMGRVVGKTRASSRVPVVNSGVGELKWSVVSPNSFFDVVATESDVEIRLKPSLLPGDYRGLFRIDSNGGSAEIEVLATRVGFATLHVRRWWRGRPWWFGVPVSLIAVIALLCVSVVSGRVDLLDRSASSGSRPAPGNGAAGPIAPGPVAALSRQGTSVDLFWIDPQGYFTTSFYNDANQDPWHSPVRLNGPVADPTSAVTAVAPDPDRLAVFWRQRDGMVGWATYDPLVAWSGDMVLGSDAVARSGSPIVAIARGSEQCSVFWVGDDGAIRVSSVDATLHSVGAPTVVTGGNAVAVGSNLAVVGFSDSRGNVSVMDIIWIRPDSTIVTATTMNAGTTWRQDAVLGRHADPSSGVAAAALTTRDHAEAFWVSGGSVYTATDDSGTWNMQPRPVGGDVESSSTLSAVTSVDKVYAYWVGRGAAPVQTNIGPPVTCTGPRPSAARSGLVAFSHDSGQVDTVWVTDAGAIVGCFPGTQVPPGGVPGLDGPRPPLHQIPPRSIEVGGG